MEQSLPTVRKTAPLKALITAPLPPEAAESPYRPEVTREPLPVEATEQSLTTLKKITPPKSLSPAALPPEAAEDLHQPETAE
jgi:hypothetical protein